MYKNCYVTRGDEWNHYNIHLWTDEGYSVEQFQNYGYQECSDQQATHRGVKNEPLKKIYEWDRFTSGLHYADHTRGNIHTKFLIDKYGIDDEPSKPIEKYFLILR